MRKARVVLALAFLIVLAGDGRRPVEVAPVIPFNDPNVSLDVLFPGARKAMKFWFHHTGEGRATMSMPADARHAAAYIRTQQRARAMGFRFQPPELRQTRPELVLLLGPGIKYIFAIHYVGPRIILVNGWWTGQMDDLELEMLLAHELAHAIDVQSERRGHRILDFFSGEENDDVVADLLAMMMFKPGEYRSFQMKYPGSVER